MSKLQQQKAFTLLELLTAIAIVGVLIVASIPLYTTYIQNSRLKSAGEHLYIAVVKARSEAIKQQANVTFVFQSGSGWCFGATTGVSCDCNSANSCNLGQVASSDGFGDTTLTLTGIGGNTTFSGARGIVTTTGTVSFASPGGNSISVVINKMGFPRVCSSDLTGYQPC